MMKTIKKAIAFLAVLSALAAGCVQPVLEEPAAPGAGILRVNLDGGAQRTLMPSLYNVNSLYYTLAFTFSAGGREPVTERISIGESSGAFTLAAGAWSLDVKGFASEEAAAEPTNALVSGTANVTVSPDGGTVNVTLVPASAPTQSATGTLSYDISFPAEVTSASLAVYGEDGVTLADLKDSDADTPVDNPISLSLTEANTGSITLDSGVYNLGITLYMDGKAAAAGTTAHIYGGLTTAAVYEFTENDFADYGPNALITAFTLKDGSNTPYEGKIYAGNIIVPAPGLGNVAALTAELTHTGVLVSPNPAEGRDYTNPVTYTVSQEDGTEAVYTVRVYTHAVMTNVAALTAFLSSPVSGGDTADDPIPVKMQVDLADATDGWAPMLSAINSANKYLDLDLSECTMTGTEFDPGTTNTGKMYIAGLVLPDAANSIKPGTTFEFFTELKTLGASRVVTIGNFAFDECTSLASVNLPEAASIGNYAFSGTSLTSVNLPAAASIGDSAFAGTSLTSVDLPLAASIGTYAFIGCTSLTSVDLPLATNIESDAFSDCTSLVSVDLPLAASIGSYAFSDCTSLTSVDLSAATSIGNNAFYGCTSLTSVNLPAATSIGTSAFSGCTSLISVDLPLAVSIGNSAFQGCTELASVNLPNATSIGERAFYGRTKLASVDLSAATSIGNNAFSGCTSLTSVELPATASIVIGDSAFQGCTKLASVNLPNATSIVIGDSAFVSCTSLTSVDLPNAVSIGEGAFGYTGSTGLTVTLGATAPTLGVNIFTGVNISNGVESKDVVVLVPSGATGYGTVPGEYKDGSSSNWGNGFRGKGWDGSASLAGSVNTSIMLDINYKPE
jgi:hypothetical protein